MSERKVVKTYFQLLKLLLASFESAKRFRSSAEGGTARRELVAGWDRDNLVVADSVLRHIVTSITIHHLHHMLQSWA